MFNDNELTLVTCKGVYSNYYVDNFTKFREAMLSTKDEFYSLINDGYVEND